MEEEAPKLPNGAAEGDSSSAAAASSDEGLASPASFSSVEGGEVDDGALRQEVQALKRDRDGMQRRLEELVAEVERSEVEKKALAAHASYLEGALSAVQHDLVTAESAAADSDAEAQALRTTLRGLESSKIPDLEAKIAALEKREVDLGAQREEATAALAGREGEILALKRELDALQLKGKALEEKLGALEVKAKEAVEVEARKRVAREEELERALKELMEKNSEMEVKIAATNQSKIDREILPINGEKDDDTELVKVEVESSGKVSWAVAAGMAASTATVAAVATAFYLRHARQR